MANAGAQRSRPPCGQPTHLSMTCNHTHQSAKPSQSSTTSPQKIASEECIPYLDLDGLALVVHVDALAAGLLVAVVGEAHGGAEGRGEGADGLLAGAEVHVGGVLAVVVGDAGVVDGEDAGGQGREEEGE